MTEIEMITDQIRAKARAAIARRLVTQISLAQRAGVGRRTVQMFLSGRHVGTTTASKIETALAGIDVESTAA